MLIITDRLEHRSNRIIVESNVPVVGCVLLTEEIKATVFAAIGKLPEDLKSAITLREIDGLSYEEIAEVMDCPIGTVRSRIFRARDVIDKELRPLLE